MIEKIIFDLRSPRNRRRYLSFHLGVLVRHRYNKYISELLSWQRSQDVHCNRSKKSRYGKQLQISFSSKDFAIPSECISVAYRLIHVIIHVQLIGSSPRGVVNAFFSLGPDYFSVMLGMEMHFRSIRGATLRWKSSILDVCNRSSVWSI